MPILPPQEGLESSSLYGNKPLLIQAGTLSTALIPTLSNLPTNPIPLRYVPEQREFLLPVYPGQYYWKWPLTITTVPTCLSLVFPISAILIIQDVFLQEDKL